MAQQPAGKMEDSVSIKSSDSVTTSGEYEIVPEDPAAAAANVEGGRGGEAPVKKLQLFSPVLNIGSNGGILELEQNLTEVIKELEADKEEPKSATSSTLKAALELDSLQPSPCPSSVTSPDANKVGQSVFYDALDSSPMVERQAKPETPSAEENADEELSDIDQECTVFSGVSYLGNASIGAPRSEPEIRRKMSELNALSDETGLQVSVSVPNSADGVVVLYDGQTRSVVATYEIGRILFFARGPSGGADEACFAFTWAHGDSPETGIVQCHVFRCRIPEAVTRVSECFARAFQRPPALPSSLTASATSANTTADHAMLSSMTSDVAGSGQQAGAVMYEFNVSLEIREKIAKSGYQPVVRDKNVFKLRCNTDKEVAITVRQVPSDTLPPLHIERCFGVLLSPGKLVRQADMQLLDMASMGYLKPDAAQPPSLAPYQIRAEWKATDKAFEQLNLESAKMFLTVAVDLVIKGIQEPVRFVIETLVTILSQHELRIMDTLFLQKRPLALKFYLQLRPDAAGGGWEVHSIDPSEEIVEPSPQSLLNQRIKNTLKLVRSASVASFEFDDLSPTDGGSSDGDEPLLSGTGEVSKDCSQDCLEEWSAVLQEWEAPAARRPRALAALVRAGVPEALRCRVWQKLAGVEQRAEMLERYRLLITKETASEDVITRDINRTFPAHKFFKDSGGLGQDSLYKVSKAYAVYDNEVGYCQGLSFIAASLLLHMPEEESFAVLVAFMYDYGLRDLYKQDFAMLHLRLYQLNRLLREQIPDLADHFEQAGVETHMFASQWFLTLFTARFPLYFVFHVLDLFLLDGMVVLFQVALTLLFCCKKELLELDFEGTMKFLRVTLPKRVRSEGQVRRLMRMAVDWKVKKLKKYEDEYTARREEADRAEAALKMYEARFVDERRSLQAEIARLHERLEAAGRAERKGATIIADYKAIIQRQEQQIARLNEHLEETQRVVGACARCSAAVAPHSPLHKAAAETPSLPAQDAPAEQPPALPLGPLDPLAVAQQRIHELEVELAQTKLDKVEAECRSQDLNHQLNATLAEMQRGGGWQPWLSKTLNSIQERVAVSTARRDSPSFQSHIAPAERLHAAPPIAATKHSANRHSFDFSRIGGGGGAGAGQKEPIKDLAN